MIDQLLNLGIEQPLLIKIVDSLFIVVLLGALRLVIMGLINRRIEDERIRFSWQKTSKYLAFMLGVVLITPLWVSFTSVATFAGLISAGLVIALSGPLNDLAGWILIWWRRPFEIGDRIEIGQHAGDVVDIRIFKFTLLEIGNWVHADQSTGRVLHISNRKVFSEAIANYHKGLGDIWHEIEIFITFESNWKKAKALLEEIASRDAAKFSQDAAQRVQRARRRYLIYYPHLTPIVYLRGDRSGVLLAIRYLCDPRRRRSSEQAIWEDILETFAQHPDIEFAYPTQRFYHRTVERPEAQNSSMLAEEYTS